jgi:hypothetical protein
MFLPICFVFLGPVPTHLFQNFTGIQRTFLYLGLPAHNAKEGYAKMNNVSGLHQPHSY